MNSLFRSIAKLTSAPALMSQIYVLLITATIAMGYSHYTNMRFFTRRIASNIFRAMKVVAAMLALRGDGACGGTTEGIAPQFELWGHSLNSSAVPMIQQCRLHHLQLTTYKLGATSRIQVRGVSESSSLGPVFSVR